MKCFLACLAALGVGAVVKSEFRYRSNRRALQYAGAWIAFEIGTHVDAYDVVSGRLSVDDWTARQKQRERELGGALRS